MVVYVWLVVGSWWWWWLTVEMELVRGWLWGIGIEGKGERRGRDEGREGEERDEERGKRSRGWVGMKDK